VPKDDPEDSMSQPPADTRPGWSTRRKVWTVVGVVVAVLAVLVIVGNLLGPPPAQPDAVGAPAPPTTEAAPAATTEAPPPAVAQEPPPPPPPAAAARVHYPRDQVDGALTAAEKRTYAATLLAEAPSISDRFERYAGNMDEAGRYLTRDGAALCEYIANGETPDVISRSIPPRFDVNASDAPAVRRVTEQMVCPKLR
jgi:hypothetical protein